LPGEEPRAVEVRVDEIASFPHQGGYPVFAGLQAGRPEEVGLRSLTLAPDVPMLDRGSLLASVELEVGGSEFQLLPPI
jgi:hypothetical protein